MGYSRRILNYSKKVVLSDMTHMMSVTDFIASGVETLRIISVKEFIELIHINPRMVLYLTTNQVDSCHYCERGPLT